MPAPGEAPAVPVALSTASVFPQTTAEAFELGARVGYDGIEVMVSIEPTSQDPDACRHLSDYHEIPVVAVHAPTLLVTQRVWGTDPWEKLERSAEMAHELGAGTVVVHPPFRWQRSYGRDFVAGIARLERTTGLAFAVENMYPWRSGVGLAADAYAPGWDPSEQPYAHTTVDLSHCATAQADPLEMALRLGTRLHHVHLTDGLGSPKDEHLVPGRGAMPCKEFLAHLAGSGFDGSVVLEINTRRSDRRETIRDLEESLEFTREHMVAPGPAEGLAH
ncbi:sugar phosphate isomerase/epimerase [Nocardioidaceae bacterium]|nr:sugar phosphate isomerase/epimerase [Nocardioidaceae bacterium]